MTPGILIADDLALFVLDDEGIFFSASSQEIHRFNTAATYLWCCVEAGLGVGEITAAYSEALGTSGDEAARQVADGLHRWQGMGYLSGIDVPAATPIDLTTALGRLLTSAWLRAQFARSPRELARLFRLRDADLDSFLSLDPGELEAQARTLARKRKSRRAVTLAPRVKPDAPRTAGGSGACGIERRYRLLSSTFLVRFPSRREDDFVHPVLSHLETASGADADHVLEVEGSGDGYVVHEDSHEVGRCGGLDEVAPLLVDVNMVRVAVNRHPYALALHSAAVSDGKCAVLFPGPPRSGKSTLAAALLRCGFLYLSDELVLLEGKPLRARGVPLSLVIKSGALEVLSQEEPGLRELPVHLRPEGDTVRYLNPQASGHAFDSERCDPVGVIVFPRYLPAEPTVLRSISRPEALDRLLQQCVVLPGNLDRERVGDLVRWMRQVRCFELVVSSLSEAARLVSGLSSSRDAPEDSTDGSLP